MLVPRPRAAARGSSCWSASSLSDDDDGGGGGTSARGRGSAARLRGVEAARPLPRAWVGRGRTVVEAGAWEASARGGIGDERQWGAPGSVCVCVCQEKTGGQVRLGHAPPAEASAQECGKWKRPRVSVEKRALESTNRAAPALTHPLFFPVSPRVRPFKLGSHGSP